MSPDVLVVGAGPTGLALALHAHAHGSRVRIVDRRTGPRPSRALVVHPRTLEQLRPLGVVDALRRRSLEHPEALVHLGSRTVRVRLDDLGIDGGPASHPWMVRQQDVEDVLAEALGRRGVPVERGPALAGLDVTGRDGACALLRGPGGEERVEARWVAGCDGVGSTVRTLAGIPVVSRPYRQEVLLADVDLAAEHGTDLEPGVAHVAAGRGGLLFVFALGERASWRVLATRGPSGPGPHGPPDRAELQQLLDASGLGVRVARVAWSDRLLLARRLAECYRRGPLFLAGDAAHSHSPAAAQGMNLGLQDAAALGWRLAHADSARQPEVLLDSYSDERRPVARASITLTDLVFWAESSPATVAGLLRGVVAPLAAPLAPALLRRRTLTAPVLRLLAGLWVHHRHSALSRDDLPGHRGLRPGDRLPDAVVVADRGPVRLHDLTARPGTHVLLARNARDVPSAAVGPGVAVHRLRDRPGTTIDAVRPDGYLGYRGTDPARLCGWLGDIGALDPERAPTHRHPV
ncbi:FAD-dependent monooxygenase [Actinomycetospora cinnamomea]|uniref:2-polyprenyl-6-methoxyphenol hydroxylase-like FAD-dependent oxidoreductase n=1 Tax=Actinomycetospora cinnamomea TaxID=663609 RepID=A0A2U1F7G1_9PSEU|nr:FAD-dependent monooxygenase [Actinomycetospora cinnamomea]PVZ08123.1 2-polyprenyl-6-methoxyphenol hydroxylase-like FAD-dependent oxidoreductase [Actinomycetospora cinnamomea]